MLHFLEVRRSKVFFSITMLLMLSVVFGLLSYEYADEQEFAGIADQPKATPSGIVSIVIKVSERSLEVFNDGSLYKKYRIAVGKSETPTPIGEWNVVWKDYNWGTGFGTRWMGLNVPWGIYGIHGTNKPWSIGQFISHGCIRMRNKDVEELFEWVPIGTPVRIEGRRMKVQRALKTQTSGSDVALLQMKLKELGYYDGRADGLFGINTEASVKRYQADQGFPPTGRVNRAMLNQLGI